MLAGAKSSACGLKHHASHPQGCLLPSSVLFRRSQRLPSPLVAPQVPVCYCVPPSPRSQPDSGAAHQPRDNTTQVYKSNPTLSTVADDDPALQVAIQESTPIEQAAETPSILKQFAAFKPPKWLFRTVACLVLGGQVIVRICQGKIHWRNTMEQLKLVGPKSLGVALLTAGFVGMVFTIQFVREFAKLGLTRTVGGVLALALARELTPVVTAIIVAGRVGSAFAAELGTMQVSEQMDSLRVLFTDPVDYLVTPRVLASMVAGPILNVLCFCMGIGASVLLADLAYDVPANVILDSVRRALTAYDVYTSMIKSWVFGSIVATISCAWGFTTTGGAKGVGESTTSAVVISLVSIFIADFLLSFLFYQGQGDALKQLK